MKKEAKEMTRELISAARVALAYGIGAGAAFSALLAGILTIVVLAIDVVIGLSDASLFGTRQWSITLSLVVIGVLSLVMYRTLNRRCGGLLTDNADENAKIGEAEDTDDEATASPLWAFAAAIVVLFVSFAWLFVMGCFCYAAGELDAAGFGVVEVTAIEALAATLLGVIMNKVCEFEMEEGTH